jgi:hypothetical protein
MEASKHAIKAVLVTLGAAFTLLSVIEWKKLADQVPNNDTNFIYGPTGDQDHPYALTCKALLPSGGTQPAGGALADCQKLYGSNVPWTQGIKAFVYSWIGIGLLVAAFIKPKGAGISGGGYW